MALPFRSPYRHGLARVAAATPRVRPADVAFNLAQTLSLARRAHQEGAILAVFPELGLSAYAIDDLFLQDALLRAVEAAIGELAAASAEIRPILVVGAPLRVRDAVYNCAVFVQGGRVLAVAPKTYLPNYREFYERRWFASGAGRVGETISLCGAEIPFGTDIIVEAPNIPHFSAFAEVCEDIWAPLPPSTLAALAGASVLINLSASNITIGKGDDRKMLARAQSMRCAAAYIFSAAGPGESTTDLAWDGQSLIVEAGALLAEGERFPAQPQLICADVDLDMLRLERLRTATFRDCADANANAAKAFRRVSCDVAPPDAQLSLLRDVPRFPYVPADAAQLDARCYEAFEIQVQGLATRLQAAKAKTAIIGVSGGLDSTHALIVAAKTADRLGWRRDAVKAFTLPGFATSEATKANAHKLMKALAVSAAEIDIRPAAEQMLKDIGHPFAEGKPVYDVTFENVQAGLRTDYLFRLANHHGGLVIGTGDLSELALGWCTYGVGDHMAHYNVNASVSKTLIRHLISWCVRTKQYDAATARILNAILATEISPELVPADAAGALQSTQSVIGPYPLHDFSLYYFSRFGFAPSKIAYLAAQAWEDASRGDWPDAQEQRSYALDEIKHWLEVFLKRFFANQFKRSVAPNAPKVSSGGSLSPRGDWRMPSDAVVDVWLEELQRNTR